MIAVIAAWNVLSCLKMIKCKSFVESNDFPLGISSTYSKIAFSGAGWYGVYITDVSIIITLLGVCIAYQITFASLLQQIPGNTTSPYFLTILSGIIVLPISCVKDISGLSVFSLVGLICLIIGILIISIYGFYNFSSMTFESPFESPSTGERLTFFPKSIVDMTSFIGVATFCFGLCVSVFPIEEV